MQYFARKTLVCALTAAAALTASAAFAQSSVTLYGRMDLGLKYQSDKAVASTQLDSATNSGFGLKGQEDLGGGLKAFFQMEHRLDAGTGANKSTESFFNDISVVGLTGNFGTVRMGRSDNAFNLAADPDAFGGDYMGGRGNRRAGADEKWNNGVMYFSPVVGGFQAVLGTSLQERAELGGARLKNPYAVTMLYANGNLTAGLGYMERPNQDKVIGGSVTYDFGVAKTFLTVAHNDGKGNAAQHIEDEQDGKRTTYDLGVSVPVSAAGSIRAKYNYDRRALPAQAVVTTHDVGLGYLHNLSKRTQLYVTGNVEKSSYQGSTHSMDVGMLHNF